MTLNPNFMRSGAPNWGMTIRSHGFLEVPSRASAKPSPKPYCQRAREGASKGEAPIENIRSVDRNLR